MTSPNAIPDDEVEGVVALVSDLSDGQMAEFALGDAKVLLVRQGGEFSALSPKCSHLGAPLKNGVLSNGRVRCPWHGACFDAKTGDIEDFPCSDAVQCHRVRVEGEAVVVRAKKDALAHHRRQLPTARRDPDNMRTFVCVGAGPASLTCVETLRQKGFTGRVVMIGREPHLPYDRTKLSKAMSADVAACTLRPAEHLRKLDVEMLLGVSVTELDADAKTITLSNGDGIVYDGCLLASGADPRHLSAPGSDLSNIWPLRAVEHANAIAERAEGKHLVIVGSSFIGMEVASFMAGRAASVLVVGLERVPFERVLGAQVGAAVQALHESKNVKFAMQRAVREFRGTADRMVSSVVLDDGSEYAADVVVVGAGVVPSTSFVRGVELQRDGSVLVDKFLAVPGADGLWCGGDLARFPYFLTGENVRVEHYGMAMYHGSVVARNFVADVVDKTVVTSVPFFWTIQYGKSLRYAGHATSFDDVIIDGDLAAHKWTAYYVRGETVLAVATLGMDPVAAAAAELLSSSRMPSVAELRAGPVNLMSRL